MKAIRLLCVAGILFYASVTLFAQSIDRYVPRFYYGYRDPKSLIKADDCYMAVTYELEFMGDTLGSHPYKDLVRLQLGQNVSRYYSVYASICDSIWYNMKTIGDPPKYTNPHADGVPPPYTWMNDYQGIYIEDIVYRHDANKLTVNHYILNHVYYYDEDTPELNWRVSGERKTILGYSCMRATAQFRGREWSAWFTTEIPVAAGPWKLNGLPGMILGAEDGDGLFKWIAVGLESPRDESVYIYDTSYKKSRIKFKKVSRGELNSLLKYRQDDPVGFQITIGETQMVMTYIIETGEFVELKPGDRIHPYIPLMEAE